MHHGNRGKVYEPPLSPAIRAYLADFTRFVLEGKSTGDERAHGRAARDKAASFAAMVDEAAVERTRGGTRFRRAA